MKNTENKKIIFSYIISAIFIVAVAVLAYLVISNMYIDEKEKSSREAEVAVDAFAEHTGQIVNQVDVLLRGTRDVYLRTGSVSETERYIGVLKFDKSIIENIYLINRDGSFAISNTADSEGAHVNDRQYFVYHSSHKQDDLYISPVERGRVSKEYLFRLTRRINNPDGSFGGIVLATVRPESFTKYYKELQIGPENVASLIGLNDRKLRARIPPPDLKFWSIPVEKGFFDKINKNDKGSFIFTKKIDNIERSYQFEKVTGLPLVMVVGFSDNDVKYRIAEKTRWIYIGMVLFILFTCVLMLIIRSVFQTNQLLKREIDMRNQVEAVLKKSEAKYRLIVDTANEGIVSLDRETRVTFVNKKMAETLGYTVDEMLGQRYGSFMAEDQLESHAAEMAARMRGQDSVYERCFLKKDGQRHWMLASAKAVPGEKDDFVESFAMLTDINERKQYEDKLRQELKENNILLEKIEELSIRDQLTNCYNRHYLEKQMEVEITRSRRYANQLSLIMCDMDHFKMVNDTYGHLIGDMVLKYFADLLMQETRNNIEYVIRYGGEEFLIMLPQTGLEGAVKTAERIRSVLEEQSIDIGEISIPITASFGVVCADFAAGNYDYDQDELISMADEMMYKAKRAGRNQVVSVLSCEK